MRQLVVISEADAWPRAWRFQGFQMHFAAPSTPLPSFATVDCVAMVEPQARDVDAALHHLRFTGRAQAAAVVLAANCAMPSTRQLVEWHPFDALVDLAWPSLIAEAGVMMAIRNVELGRNLVEIQRVVIEEAQKDTSSLYDLAVHDGLTNLYNNRHFAALMHRQHEKSQRSRETYALVVIDLDDLKHLNTRHGHAGGSKALNELAATIAASTRADDVAVRLGGDEFAVFLADCTKEQGVEFANRLCARLRDHVFDVDGKPLSITISCGVSSFPEDGETYPQLLKHADHALLRAKALGKNRVVGFTPELESLLEH